MGEKNEPAVGARPELVLIIPKRVAACEKVGRTLAPNSQTWRVGEKALHRPPGLFERKPAAGDGRRGGAILSPQRFTTEKFADRPGQRSGIVGRNNLRHVGCGKDLARSADIGRHNRPVVGGGLQKYATQRLLQCTMRENGEFVHYRGYIVSPADKEQSPGERRLLRRRFQLLFVFNRFDILRVALADVHECRVHLLLAQQPGGVDEVANSFSQPDLPDGADNRHIGGKAEFFMQCAGRGAKGEQFEINAVVHDPRFFRRQPLTSVKVDRRLRNRRQAIEPIQVGDRFFAEFKHVAQVSAGSTGEIGSHLPCADKPRHAQAVGVQAIGLSRLNQFVDLFENLIARKPGAGGVENRKRQDANLLLLQLSLQRTLRRGGGQNVEPLAQLRQHAQAGELPPIQRGVFEEKNNARFQRFYNSGGNVQFTKGYIVRVNADQPKPFQFNVKSLLLSTLVVCGTLGLFQTVGSYDDMPRGAGAPLLWGGNIPEDLLFFGSVAVLFVSPSGLLLLYMFSPRPWTAGAFVLAALILAAALFSPILLGYTEIRERVLTAGGPVFCILSLSMALEVAIRGIFIHFVTAAFAFCVALAYGVFVIMIESMGG